MSTPNNTQLGNKPVQKKTQKLRSLPRATAWGNDRDADSYHHHPIRHVDVCRSGHAAI